MNIPYAAYRTLTTILFILLFPAFWCYTLLSRRYRTHIKERLGCYPRSVLKALRGSPRIWIHAVSLGEVKVAASLIHALWEMMPHCRIVLSTFTEHGRALASEILGPSVPLIYAPLDFPLAVRKALLSIRPHAMVFLETEIWPNWIFKANRCGARTLLVNGRISPGSIEGYLRFKPFFREVLKAVDRFSMITKEDARRIMAMGADLKKVETNGNAKYDLLAAAPDQSAANEMRQIFSLGSLQRVLVAGSTRKGEEAMVLDAYQKIRERFPDTLLIIAPRHIRRIPSIAALVETRGLRYHLYSDLAGSCQKRKEKIVLVDTFGELFNIYSIATIVFCGGSLVPLGGQNPLEPAAWAKPVFYGPHMDNFLDAKAMLEDAGAGIQVSNSKDFARKALWYLHHPDKMKEVGERARQVVRNLRGAARRHAEVICRLLEKDP